MVGWSVGGWGGERRRMKELGSGGRKCAVQRARINICRSFIDTTGPCWLTNCSSSWPTDQPTTTTTTTTRGNLRPSTSQLTDRLTNRMANRLTSASDPPTFMSTHQFPSFNFFSSKFPSSKFPSSVVSIHDNPPLSPYSIPSRVFSILLLSLISYSYTYVLSSFPNKAWQSQWLRGWTLLLLHSLFRASASLTISQMNGTMNEEAGASILGVIAAYCILSPIFAIFSLFPQKILISSYLRSIYVFCLN